MYWRTSVRVRVSICNLGFHKLYSLGPLLATKKKGSKNSEKQLWNALNSKECRNWRTPLILDQPEGKRNWSVHRLIILLLYVHCTISSKIVGTAKLSCTAIFLYLIEWFRIILFLQAPTIKFRHRALRNWLNFKCCLTRLPCAALWKWFNLKSVKVTTSCNRFLAQSLFSREKGSSLSSSH